jgi:hypothetical protein
LEQIVSNELQKIAYDLLKADRAQLLTFQHLTRQHFKYEQQ